MSAKKNPSKQKIKRLYQEDCKTQKEVAEIMDLSESTVSYYLRKWGISKESLSPEKRFWRKVNKLDNGDCWIWTGSKGRDGYGMAYNGDKKIAAHRYSWIIENGEIPSSGGYHGTCVCHKCDNKLCVNPEHLFLASQKENIRDAIKKGRLAEGEKHPKSKLTNKQVREIRRLYKSGGWYQYQLADKYSVDASAISRIVNRKAYKNA